MENKINIIKLFLITFLFFSCTNQSNKENNHENRIENSQREEIENTIKHFLKWYKSNYEKISSFNFIPAYDGDSILEQYKVDFVEVKQYLNTLKSSGYISQEFINTKELYFKKCNEELLSSKQMEGVPPCWDGDIILYTQEPDDVLNNIDKAKFSDWKLEENTASVKMTTVYNLSISLKKENGKWMITDTKGLGKD